MQLPEHIAALIDKYLAGSITEEEQRLLNEWYHSFNDSGAEVITPTDETAQQLSERIKNRLAETIRQEQPLYENKRIHIGRISTAAAIILLLLVGSYFLFSSPQPTQHPIAKTTPDTIEHKNDIAPGGNKAILTLADGSTIIIDSAANGIISRQGNSKVQKLDNGSLVYTINGKEVKEGEEAFYNTLTTPRGGQYHITLADGTGVWLNAASSIRFPVMFTGSERKVVLTGEAYFEVAKNKDMPFKVMAGSSEVEVLGTHFNVNAYNDELSIKTTLLEGSVKVSVPNQPAKFLKPGQQSGINKKGEINTIDKADTEAAVAWKNGRFQFKSADLPTILRQIARWYDVDIVYNGNVSLHFTGQLSKSLNASKIFETLSLTNEVHFKIDGKKVIVSP